MVLDSIFQYIPVLNKAALFSIQHDPATLSLSLKGYVDNV